MAAPAAAPTLNETELCHGGRQFIQPIDPFIYYRVESGLWLFEGFENVELYEEPERPGTSGQYRMVEGAAVFHTYSGEANVYFDRVTPEDVFTTFCHSNLNMPTKPARLVYNTLAHGNFRHAVRPDVNGLITVIKIVTTKRLQLAEEYIRNVRWTTTNGEARVGCPRGSMLLQQVTGREYVIQPDDVDSIDTMFYRTDDTIEYIPLSWHHVPFLVSSDGTYITDGRTLPPPLTPKNPVIPSDWKMLANEDRAALRKAKSEYAAWLANPLTFFATIRIQPHCGVIVNAKSARAGN